MKWRSSVAIFFLLFGVGFFFVHSVHAQQIAGTALNELSGIKDNTGIQDTDVPSVIGNAAEIILGVTGIFFLVLMVYAGIKWMLARGQEDQIAASRRTVIAATIGIIITASSYAITVYIVGALITGQTAGSPLATPGNGTPGSPVVTSGCCLVQVANEGSTAETGWNYSNIGGKYWVWYMANQSTCMGHVAGAGTIITAGPEWTDVDQAACMEAHSNKATIEI